MGVIGRTLAMGVAASAVVAVSAQTQLPCTPENQFLPAGYACGGANSQSIVDAQGNTYGIQNGQLVRLQTASACPTNAQLSALGDFDCYAETYGYVIGPNQGLWKVSGNQLVELTASPISVPAGFTLINDGSGDFLGPAGLRWSTSSVGQLVPSGVGQETFACPESQLPAGYFCDFERAPQYIIGPNDEYIVRDPTTGNTRALTATIGQAAPAGFTWSFSNNSGQLTGPRGFTWAVAQNGSLSKTDEVIVVQDCNNGFPLPSGYECAGFDYGYIIDGDYNFFVISAQGSLEPLTITADGKAPQGFDVREDGRTMTGPQGGRWIYSVGENRELVVSEDVYILTECPAARLPPGWDCAAAPDNYVTSGSDNGLFGYVIHLEDNGLYNYYVVEESQSGANLVRLSTTNGAVPAGFRVLRTDSDIVDGIRLVGPDASIQHAFEIGSNGFLQADGDVGVEDSTFDEERCFERVDDLPTGYFCAENGGEAFNYIIKDDNYYVFSGSSAIRPLYMQNNIAPAGFTVLTSEDGVTLQGPEDNGKVYSVDANGKLVARDPAGTTTVLTLEPCPASRLPSGFMCAGGDPDYGYVLGRLNPNDSTETTRYEYYEITGNRLVRLKATNGVAPAGFIVLSDGATLRGPVSNGREYTVNAAGELVSQKATNTNDVTGYFCEARDLPTGYHCVNTVPSLPEWCNGIANTLTGTFSGMSGQWLDMEINHLNDVNSLMSATGGPDPALRGNSAPYKFLSASKKKDCDKWWYRRNFGGVLGTTLTKQNTNGIIEVTEASQHGYGYILNDDYNYYHVNGRDLVRLALSNGELPAGFTQTSGGLYLGPDADATALGWKYSLNADGTFEATGGTSAGITIYKNVCPAERLPLGYSCIEDYDSANSFEFYIRNDLTRNLYSLSADGSGMEQVTIRSGTQIAPPGFSFVPDNSAVLIGPLGRTYDIVNRRVVYDADNADNEALENEGDDMVVSNQAGNDVDDYDCQDNVADPAAAFVLGTPAGVDFNGQDGEGDNYMCVNSQLDSTIEYVQTGVCGSYVDPADPTVCGFQLKVIKDNRLVNPGSMGTPNNPQVPAGWPTGRDGPTGAYLDQNGNRYHFVYANQNGFTAQVVYEDAAP